MNEWATIDTQLTSRETLTSSCAACIHTGWPTWPTSRSYLPPAREVIWKRLGRWGENLGGFLVTAHQQAGPHFPILCRTALGHHHQPWLIIRCHAIPSLWKWWCRWWWCWWCWWDRDRDRDKRYIPESLSAVISDLLLRYHVARIYSSPVIHLILFHTKHDAGFIMKNFFLLQVPSPSSCVG